MSAITSTAALVANPGKYLDWRTWLLGLWSNCAVAGATAISTWVGSNGVEGAASSIPVEWIHAAAAGAGMSYKAAIVQFVFHIVAAGAKYVSDTKGLPAAKTNPPFVPAAPAPPPAT